MQLFIIGTESATRTPHVCFAEAISDVDPVIEAANSTHAPINDVLSEPDELEGSRSIAVLPHDYIVESDSEA
jgi:hypothetical protein